jgi:hypothetical protein
MKYYSLSEQDLDDIFFDVEHLLLILREKIELKEIKYEEDREELLEYEDVEF